MRTREEVLFYINNESPGDYNPGVEKLTIELLLDIRELLTKEEK